MPDEVLKAQLEGESAQIVSTQTEALALRVKELVIETPEQQTDVVDSLVVIKQTIKALEEARKRVAAPLVEKKKQVDAHFNRAKLPLQEAEVAGKRALGAYQERLRSAQREEEERRLLEARREEEERKRKAAEDAAREAKALGMAEEEAKKHVGEATSSVRPVIPRMPTEAPKTAHGDMGSASTREVWKFEVTAEAAVPREYCTPDPKKIRAVVAAGVREIPGVKIWAEQSVTVR